jgi:type IV pilus assembly protein PilZ
MQQPMSSQERRRRNDPVANDRRSSRGDRRAHQRIQMRVEVDFQCEDTFVFSYSADLSEMGIFIRTPVPYSAGTSLRLQFRPRGAQPISVAGRVAWAVPLAQSSDPGQVPGMGVEFIDLSPSQRERILDMVRGFAYLGDGHPGD